MRHFGREFIKNGISECGDDSHRFGTVRKAAALPPHS